MQARCIRFDASLFLLIRITYYGIVSYRICVCVCVWFFVTWSEFIHDEMTPFSIYLSS